MVDERTLPRDPLDGLIVHQPYIDPSYHVLSAQHLPVADIKDTSLTPADQRRAAYLFANAPAFLAALTAIFMHPGRDWYEQSKIAYEAIDAYMRDINP